MKTMTKPVVLGLFLATAIGCQEIRLRHRATDLVATTPGVQEQQVLDDLALMIAKPCALPYFAIPATATAQIARTEQASYTMGGDFITGAGKYLGLFLLDKHTGGLQATNQCQESWQLQPVNDPDKLLLMQSALHSVLGVDDPYRLTLFEMNETLSPWAQYNSMIQPGNWFVVGSRKDVPRHCCYVGHYCETYVWVAPGHEAELARLTLAMLNIATFESTSVSKMLGQIGAVGPVTVTDSMLRKARSTLASMGRQWEEKCLQDMVGKKYDTYQLYVREVLGCVRPGGATIDPTDFERRLLVPTFAPRLQPPPATPPPTPSPS